MAGAQAGVEEGEAAVTGAELVQALGALRESALRDLAGAASEGDLELWRAAVLGRRGSLAVLIGRLGDVEASARRDPGRLANSVKGEFEVALEERRRALTRTVPAAPPLDVTLPGRPAPSGRLHPTTQVIRRITEIFQSMGFLVAEGPEVEWDYYNFEALNIPRDHPARDMWDTLWIDPAGARPMLLRTHTSPVQVRVMERTRPPIRVIVPGRCFRYEATDATHESCFFQIEGLAVDRHITFADLKGTLYEFAKRLFGEERRIRFRCDYFPFVEPGVDMAIDCFACAGTGCRLCSDSGWIEILGAGMVHPEVLRRVGIDPRRYSGFAFGLGPERVAMLTYGIDDIRHFYANDLRFLRQF